MQDDPKISRIPRYHFTIHKYRTNLEFYKTENKYSIYLFILGKTLTCFYQVLTLENAHHYNLYWRQLLANTGFFHYYNPFGLYPQLCKRPPVVIRPLPIYHYKFPFAVDPVLWKNSPHCLKAFMDLGLGLGFITLRCIAQKISSVCTKFN